MESILIAIAASILGLIVLYYIILWAASAASKAGNKELSDLIRLQTQLKILEMKKAGITDAEIQKQIDFVYPGKKK